MIFLHTEHGDFTDRNMNFLSTALLFLVSLFGVNLTCLHKGCPLTPGLKIEHLEAAIQVGLCPSEFWKDIFRVVQWNILYDKTNGSDSWENRKKDLCDYIRRMKPTVRKYVFLLITVLLLQIHIRSFLLTTSSPELVKVI